MRPGERRTNPYQESRGYVVVDMEGITATEDVLGGDPRLDGRRIGVRHVVELVLEAGKEPAVVADELDISVAEVHLALASHYSHPEEMAAVRDRHRERMRAAAESSIQPPDAAQR